MKSPLSAPLAITTGDHRGIGPEVIAKGLYAFRKKIPTSKVLILGLPELYEPFQKLLPKPWTVWNEDFSSLEKGLNFLVPQYEHIPFSKQAAYLSGRYIELAIELAMKKKVSALITGPIDKVELHRGGYRFDGHTEMLQKLCKVPHVTMMLACPKMRVVLVTTHLAVKDISKNLKVERIVECIETTAKSLKRMFNIKTPRLAVLGLNPHASDQGMFGNEEQKVITPAILKCRKKLPGVLIEGPFAPDGFFAQWKTRHEKNFDAIVCMYHDQGLIPVKLYDFDRTVNVTLGLPIIRTSVDHGIGLDIVGQNKANPSSFKAALELAHKLASKTRSSS